MSSLAQRVARKSIAMATPIAQAYAEGNMIGEVLITRGGWKTFVRSTGSTEAPTRSKVFQGDARIYSLTGGQVYSLGDEPQYYSITRVSITEAAPEVKIDDDVLVLAHPDGGIVGRHYRVTDVEQGGEIPSERRLTVTTVAPSPNVTL